MLHPLDNYFLKQPEPYQSCMLAIRTYVLNFNTNITEHLKFGIPFFYYKGKWMCYLNLNKKGELYIGFIDGLKLKHTKLIAEGRKSIKVLYINPDKDLPIKTIREILQKAINAKKA